MSSSVSPIVIIIFSLRICTNSFAIVSGNASVSELRRMASSGDTATPEKVPLSDTEVVSVDLPAPDGWRKKFTPRKGGTPKRNEIMFISPTGEEITNKRQLEQYLRSHAGGPPLSEFDWGTGDTPRRSARLSSKTKATETPEDERPKKERKSSSKKGLKDKSGDTETENHGEAKDAAATKESADQEMPVTEDHATKEEVGADTVDQGATEGLKDKSGDTETLGEAKDAAATKESADQEMPDTEDHATQEEVGADTVDQGATEGLKDKSGDTETETLGEAKDAVATKESADQEMPDTQDLATEEVGADTVDQGATENKSEEKTNENIEVETEELNKEGPEEAVKADTDVSIPESGKESVKEVEENENEDLLPVSEGKGDENAEPEDSDSVPPDEKKECGKGNDKKPEDPVVPPQTSEVHKEEASIVKDAKDGVLPSKNDGHIDDRDGTAPNRAQSANCEDGQHQPKASPVNC